MKIKHTGFYVQNPQNKKMIMQVIGQNIISVSLYVLYVTNQISF